jgi:predicted PurR-regulated permease PerM
MLRNGRRRYVLAGALVVLGALAVLVLSEVLGTVFLAVTVAYVLLPVRNRFRARGYSRQAASVLTAAVASGLLVAAAAALVFVLFRQSDSLEALLERVPSMVSVAFAGFTYSVELSTITSALSEVLADLAESVARAAPVVTLKAVLFAILVFALLLQPGAAGRAARGLVPKEYHDVLVALDRRTRQTLYGIYVLQAATALGTAVVALVVFLVLGYSAPLTLAIIAGVLQFIPVVGPSVLVGGLAVFDLALGNPERAVLVAVLGSVLVAFAPDAVIRPRLAARTAELPTSLYFIGFVGGVLTVGAIGFIAGPLVVALIVELVGLLSTANNAQHGLEEFDEPDEFDGPDESDE